MCFDHWDYDWYAELTHEESGPNDKERKCRECGDTILVGAWRYYLYGRQYEECQTCERDEEYNEEHPNEPLDEDRMCNGDYGGDHDYGEEFSYWRCEACDKLLKAIEEQEKEEGCRGEETRPPLEELGQVLWDDPHYLEKALEMFPELADATLVRETKNSPYYIV